MEDPLILGQLQTDVLPSPSHPAIKDYVTETMELLEKKKADVCKLIDTDYMRFFSCPGWCYVLSPDEHQQMGEEDSSEPLICFLITKFKTKPTDGRHIVDILQRAAKHSRNAYLEYLLDGEKNEAGQVVNHKLNMFFTFVHWNWEDFTSNVVIDLNFLKLLERKEYLAADMVLNVENYKFQWQKQAFCLVRLLRTQEDWYPHLLYALCEAKQEAYLHKCHDDLLKEWNDSSTSDEPLTFNTIKNSVDKWFEKNYRRCMEPHTSVDSTMSTDGAMPLKISSAVDTNEKIGVATEESGQQNGPPAILNGDRVVENEQCSEEAMDTSSEEDEVAEHSDMMGDYEAHWDKDDPAESPQPPASPMITTTLSQSVLISSFVDNKPSTSSPPSAAKSNVLSPALSSPQCQPREYTSAEIEMANLLGITRSSEASKADPHTDSAEAPLLRKSLELRPYQRDLAKDACDKHNVIIVAPTNSGKTHVAMCIAQNHLQRDSKHRVLFIVHRVNLVDQQYKQFVDYFPQNEVEKMSGGGNNLLPLSQVITNKKIVVLTVDILRNALELSGSDDRFYLSYVSLLIFDECHNCMKDHPYNAVMDFYFHEHDNVKSSIRKPQVVGLTASPGTGQAENQEKAFEHLLTLCANLDCKRIAYKSEEEVQTYMKENNISDAQLDVVEIHAAVRSVNWLDMQLQDIMKTMENALQALQNLKKISSDCGALLNIPINKRGGNEYTNFVGNLASIARYIKPEDTETRTTAECLRSLLDILNRSLQVYMLFRDEDVIRFLKKCLASKYANPVNFIEDKLLERLRKEVIAKSSEHVEENPCLQQLKQQVLNQVTKEPDSRILVFVKERLYTTLLVDAFRDDPNMSHIPVDAIVGAQNDTDTVHSTQNWQSEVLNKFREGHNKVLFSTSVTEEGLDIVKCNLVVRYVHVTNEIAMVQSRGRARAGHSKYVLIYHAHESWIGNKEDINKHRHKMMISAVERFHKFNRSGSETDRMIDNIIRERKVVRGRKKETNATASKPTKDYQFQCKKCQEVASYSRYIRKQGSHYFCIDPTVRDRCVMRRKNEKHGDLEIVGKLLCGKCKSHPWGVQCVYNGKTWVALSIKHLYLFPVLENNALGSCELRSKWTAVPFHVKDLDLAEQS